MKVCHALICCFFLTLQDGNIGLVDAQISVYSGTEGGDVRIKCPSSFSGNRKLFCKEECKRKDIIIDTTNVTAQNGRYSIEWKKKQRTSSGDVYLTITQLTKSDSGLYRCGLGSSGFTYERIEIIVVDALLTEDTSKVKTLYKRPGGNITVECYFTRSGSTKYFCKGDCKDKLVERTSNSGQRGRYSIRYVEGTPSGGFLYVSITQLTKSDSGHYGCGLDILLSEDPYLEFDLIVTDAPTTTSSVPSTTSSSSGNSTLSSASTETTEQSVTTTDTTAVLLYVGLTLVLMVILSLSVLMCYRKRTSKPKDPPVETQYAYITESNQVYENIGEKRPSRTSPVETSSVYSNVKHAEPNGAETNYDYSVITADGFQNTAEDDSSRLTYSQVNFSNVDSSNSAPRGDVDNVIYSVPRVEESSDVSHPEADVSLYSTVNI